MAPVAPVTMNAFELISKSQGLNLSSLFEKQMVCLFIRKWVVYFSPIRACHPRNLTWNGLRKWNKKMSYENLSNYIVIGSQVLFSFHFFFHFPFSHHHVLLFVDYNYKLHESRMQFLNIMLKVSCIFWQLGTS